MLGPASRQGALLAEVFPFTKAYLHPSSAHGSQVPSSQASPISAPGQLEGNVQADQSPVPQRSFFKQTLMLGEKERKEGREGALHFIKAKKPSVIRSTLIYLSIRKRKCCRQSICEIRSSFYQLEDTSQFQICQNVGEKVSLIIGDTWFKFQAAQRPRIQRLARSCAAAMVQ